MSLLSLKRSESNEKTSVFPGPSHLSKSSCCTLWKTGVVYYLMFSEVFASFAGRQVRVIFDWSMNGKNASISKWRHDRIGLWHIISYGVGGCYCDSKTFDETWYCEPFCIKSESFQRQKRWKNLPGSNVPEEKNKKSQIQPWSLTWNLTNQALQGQGIPLWRNIHFQVPGCCLSTQPTSMKLAIRAFQDTKLELFIGHLDIVLPTIPQNGLHQKKAGGFLFHRKICTYQSSTYPLFVGCLIVDMVIMVSCNFFVPPLQFARLQDISLLPHMKLWRNPKRDNGLTDTHHQVLHQRCRCISFTATYNIEHSE